MLCPTCGDSGRDLLSIGVDVKYCERCGTVREWTPNGLVWHVPRIAAVLKVCKEIDRDISLRRCFPMNETWSAFIEDRAASHGNTPIAALAGCWREDKPT